jgi:hypothetical protein
LVFPPALLAIARVDARAFVLPAVAAAERAWAWWWRGSAQPGEQVYSKTSPLFYAPAWRARLSFILC